MVGTVAVIGAGVIGGAIVKCLQESDEVGKVIATRRSLEALKALKELGAQVTTDNKAAAKKADLVFLCVKPGDVGSVLKEIEEEIEGKLVISTAAIIPLEYYSDAVPGARYVRSMPNIAALAKASFTAYACDPKITSEDRATVKALLNTMGTSTEVEEKYMDAVTGLTGSGPAFVAIVIDALMFAGLKVGLPRELSLRGAAVCPRRREARPRRHDEADRDRGDGHHPRRHDHRRHLRDRGRQAPHRPHERGRGGDEEEFQHARQLEKPRLTENPVYTGTAGSWSNTITNPSGTPILTSSSRRMPTLSLVMS